MTDEKTDRHWHTLDRDLGRIASVEYATQIAARPMVGIGIALAFIIVAALAAAIFFVGTSSSYVVVAAAAVGAYMAVNIGANDVANNMGPAVGRQCHDHGRGNRHCRDL